MAVSSMTGFARAAGANGAWRWAFELKSVNAKGLDLRLQDAARRSTGSRPRRARGSARRWRAAPALRRFPPSARAARARPRIDEAALAAIAAAARAAAETAGLAPPTMDGLLAVRGVVEIAEAEDDEAGVAAACAGALASLDEALAALGRRPPRRGRGAGQGAARAARRHRSADARRRRQSGAQARGDPGAARRKRRGADRLGRAASTRTGCIRRRSCSPPRPTSARSSTG